MAGTPLLVLSYDASHWGGHAAAATIITPPVHLIALLVRKHIVRGLALGALKG